MTRDFLDDDRLTSDQGGGAGAQWRGLLDVPHCEWPDQADTSTSGEDEREKLEWQATIGRGDGRGGDRPNRDQRKGQCQGQHLGYPEHACQDQPHEPRVHGLLRNIRAPGGVSLRLGECGRFRRADALSESTVSPARSFRM